MEELEKGIEKIKAKISTYKISMSRVPKNTYLRFMELASEEEFCSDYGQALKFLLDFYYGLVPTGLEQIQAEIMALKQEIELLKSQKRKDSVRKTLSGKEIGGKD